MAATALAYGYVGQIHQTLAILQVMDFVDDMPGWASALGVSDLFSACTNAPLNPDNSYVFGILPE